MTPLSRIAEEIFALFQLPLPSDPDSESKNGIPSSQIMKHFLIRLKEAHAAGVQDGLERAAEECESFCPYVINNYPCKSACNMHENARAIRALGTRPRSYTMEDSMSETSQRMYWQARARELEAENAALKAEINTVREISGNRLEQFMKTAKDRDQWKAKAEHYRESLDACLRNDRSEEYEYAERNPRGERPGIGQRWKTPREIAREALKEGL